MARRVQIEIGVRGKRTGGAGRGLGDAREYSKVRITVGIGVDRGIS